MQTFAVFLGAVLATLPASAVPLLSTSVSHGDLSKIPNFWIFQCFVLIFSANTNAKKGVHEKRDIGPDADAGQFYIYDRRGMAAPQVSGHDHGHVSEAGVKRDSDDVEPDIGLQYQMYSKRETDNVDPDIGLQYQMYSKRENNSVKPDNVDPDIGLQYQVYTKRAAGDVQPDNVEPDIGLQYQMYAKRETDNVEPDIGLQYQMYSKRETDNVEPDIGLQYQMYT